MIQVWWLWNGHEVWNYGMDMSFAKWDGHEWFKFGDYEMGPGNGHEVWNYGMDMIEFSDYGMDMSLLLWGGYEWSDLGVYGMDIWRWVLLLHVWDGHEVWDYGMGISFGTTGWTCGFTTKSIAVIVFHWFVYLFKAQLIDWMWLHHLIWGPPMFV